MRVVPNSAHAEEWDEAPLAEAWSDAARLASACARWPTPENCAKAQEALHAKFARLQAKIKAWALKDAQSPEEIQRERDQIRREWEDIQDQIHKNKLRRALPTAEEPTPGEAVSPLFAMQKVSGGMIGTGAGRNR